MFGDVIVPLDGTMEATRALGPAGAVARYLDSTVVVVSVAEDPVTIGRVQTQLTAIGDVSRRIRIVERPDDVADVIAESVVASPGAIVAMASHGVDDDDCFPGVAARVLSHALVPVLLVGPNATRRPFRCHGPLVAAVAADPVALSILPVVRALGTVFDFDLELVTVTDDAEDPGHGDRGDHGLARAVIDLRDLAHDTAQAIAVPVHTQPIAGSDVARALIDRAVERHATLLAMASHGDPTSSGPDGITLAVVRDAPCPVLAVRPALATAPRHRAPR